MITVLLIFLVALAVGFLGSMLGIGGGVLIIPLLTILFNIPIKTARDRALNLSRGVQLAIATGFLVVLPLFMVGSGVFIWLRRRKR